MRNDRTNLLRTVALGIGLAIGAHATVHAADGETEAAQTRQLALVKIEIKQPSGKIVKNEGALVEWNENASVVIDADERKHAVSLQVKRESEKASKLEVTLAYDVDGNPIIAPYSFDTRVKKREVIHIEGGLAIALTVTPKTVRAEPPKKKREKIEDAGNANDPLDGL
jgi:hypothetical protein